MTEVTLSTDTVIGPLKILNQEVRIPNYSLQLLLVVKSNNLQLVLFLLDALAYGFDKYSIEGNVSSPARPNENSLVSSYKRLNGGMLRNPSSSANPILLPKLQRHFDVLLHLCLP